MMYQEGQYVRLERNNELKLVKEVVTGGNNNMYVCCDDKWYNEDELYPHEMKIEVKNTLNELLSLSDFGEPKKVLSDLVDYVSNMNEKEFNKFLKIIETSEINLEGTLY